VCSFARDASALQYRSPIADCRLPIADCRLRSSAAA
jgi:hypothetical protein